MVFQHIVKIIAKIQFFFATLFLSEILCVHCLDIFYF